MAQRDHDGGRMTAASDYARAVMPGASDGRTADSALRDIRDDLNDAYRALGRVWLTAATYGYVRTNLLALALYAVSGLLRCVEGDRVAMEEKEGDAP
jgi:hypothetical protein